MKRLLCLWFPNWPIQRLLAVRPELKRQVVVLFARDRRRGQVVVACSSAAQKQGLRVGVPLTEAVALIEHGRRTSHTSPVDRRRHVEPADQLARLGIWPHDPAADQLALEQLVAWAETYSPRVALDQEVPQEGLLLDLTGISERHGGEVPLAFQLKSQLQQRGYWAHLGVADTLGAAWALAHWGQASGLPASEHQPLAGQRPTVWIAPPGKTESALDPLPVAALRLTETTLQWLQELGVQRIEQLKQLPRAGISSRLGAEVLQRWDQALGRRQELFVVHHPLPSLMAQWQAEHPTARYEVIERVIEHLNHSLAEQLLSQQQGALQLCCCLFCESHSAIFEKTQSQRQPRPIELNVCLFQPTTQPDYLWKLLRAQLEQTSLPGPIVKIELRAIATAPLQQRQFELWNTESRGTDGQQLAHLIDRISNRLGVQAVSAARLRAGALPESAYGLLPLTGAGVSAARLNAGLKRTPPAFDHRPLQLICPPSPIRMISQSSVGAPQCFMAADQIQQAVQAWGPERIETSWWEGPCVRRDYYRVHCKSGSRLWLFQNLQDQRWFLHGEFS